MSILLVFPTIATISITYLIQWLEYHFHTTKIIGSNIIVGNNLIIIRFHFFLMAFNNCQIFHNFDLGKIWMIWVEFG